MSPARTKSGTDQRICRGDAIVEELRASRLPVEPRQFEFWFAYKSGRNPALNAAAAAIKSHTGALTGPDIERLHQAHLSPWRMAKDPDAATACLTKKLDDIVITLDGAIGTARAQRETLTAEAAQLGGGGKVTLQDILSAVDRLTRATKESQARFALLEARMDAASRDVGVLQCQLSAVRTECQLDPTTTLPNRATFNAILDKTLANAAETRQPLSVVVCNLDHFKAFNENFGNDVGDEALRSIGTLFKAQIRACDTVARFGGDEYAAILPHMRASDAVACAERFRQVLMAQELIEHPNGTGRVTASIGVADAIKGDTPEFLLRRAGNAVRVAKREGRNRVVEMTPDGPAWKAERRA
jgi:diguanylate cyclase